MLPRMGEHAPGPEGSSQAEPPENGCCLLMASLRENSYVLFALFDFKRRPENLQGATLFLP